MKRTLFGAFLVSIATAITAQPVINSTDVLPSINDSWFQSSFEASTITPGDSGANATWDFSALSPTGNTEIIIKDPASTTSGPLFPNANLAFDDDSLIIYYEGNNSGLNLYGVDAQGNQVVYGDKDEHLIFPVTFGTTNTDFFSGTANITIPNVGSFTSFRSGTSTMEADAYGTLILPTGTFNNVLRIKLTSLQEDSVNLFIFDTIINTTIVSYQWIVAGTPSPLMTWSRTVSEIQPLPLIAGSYLDNTVGIADYKTSFSNFSLSNNVSNTNTTVNYSLEKPGAVSIRVFSLLGKEVMSIEESRQSSGNHRQELSLNELPSGIYFVNGLIDGSSSVTKKLVIP